MIVPPRRAVTRFFIPMIDVLILLFCIFLLMPFVSKPEDGSGAVDAVTVKDLAEDTAKLKRDLAIAERRIAELKKERANLFDRFRVKVLEIDQENGKLYSFEDATAGRKEIATRAEAERLINQERERAGAKDVCFLILYPRDLTGFPLREQIDTYRQWFHSVPHAFDNPWTR
ncbi:hypothetical protein BH11PLA2_BH11PLA2_39020 [soil metagenome]